MRDSLFSQPDTETWIDHQLGSMTLEQKVGQLMVFPLYGALLTPDVVELVEKFHIGGIRITQKFHPGTDEHRRKTPPPEFLARSLRPPDQSTYDRQPELPRITWTPREQAEAINKLQDIAANRPGGIPLHFVFDQEGEGADFLFQQRLLPYPMGLRASNDPTLAYRAARAIGAQARALGAHLIHSPVLDVNTNPRNPEIGPRSYSNRPDEVAEYALASLRGFNESGIACAGKHFPGRGASAADAHFGLPTIEVDREEMYRVHIEPFRQLIDNGIQAIMAAFTAYPALDDSGVPAAVSKKIITGLLREELGFDGIITTDNIEMGGLLERYKMSEAAILALNAGCDLILCRSYTPVRKALIQDVIRAVREGRYSEQALDASVARILRFRKSQGLLDERQETDPQEAGKLFDDAEIIQIAREAAVKSVLIQRDADELLPLPRDKKILLIEQSHHFHTFINNSYAHPGILWQEMCKHSEEVGVVMVNEAPTDEDLSAIRQRLSEADIVVATAYYNYRTRNKVGPFIKTILAEARKPVVTVTNTPYSEFGAPKEAGTVVVSFCPSGRENVSVIAKVLFGELQPTASLNDEIR